MGDAAAQQQQTPAFFAAFPPTSGRKEVGDLSQLHHGSIRTLPLGKLENLVRTDKVPLAVFLKRCGCQVAFQVDFCICFGKALELCFVGDTANINLSRLIDEDALSKRMGEVVYNNLKDAVSRGDKPPKPREPDGTFLDVLHRATTEVIVTLKNMNGTEYLNRVYARPQDGLGNMFNNVRYGSMSASTLARASRLVACWDQTRTTHSRLVTNTTSTRVAWTANGFLKDLKMIARQSNIYKNTKKAVQAVVVMKLFKEHHGAGQHVNGLGSRWELNAVGACVGGLDNSKQKAFIRAIRDAALRYVNDQCPVAGVEGGDSDGDGDGDGERDGDGDIFGSDSDSDSDGGPGEDGEGAAEGSVRNNTAAPFVVCWHRRAVTYPPRVSNCTAGFPPPELQTYVISVIEAMLDTRTRPTRATSLPAASESKRPRTESTVRSQRIGDIPSIKRRVNDMNKRGVQEKKMLELLFDLINEANGMTRDTSPLPRKFSELQWVILNHAGLSDSEEGLRGNRVLAITRRADTQIEVVREILVLLGITRPTDRTDQVYALAEFLVRPVDPSFGSTLGERTCITYKCSQLVEQYDAMRSAAKPDTAAAATASAAAEPTAPTGDSSPFLKVDQTINDYLQRSNELREGMPFSIFSLIVLRYVEALVDSALASFDIHPDAKRTAYQFAKSAVLDERPPWLDGTVAMLGGLWTLLQDIDNVREEGAAEATEAARSRLEALSSRTEEFVQKLESQGEGQESKQQEYKRSGPLAAAQRTFSFCQRILGRGLSTFIPRKQSDFRVVRAQSKLTTFQRHCIEPCKPRPAAPGGRPPSEQTAVSSAPTPPESSRPVYQVVHEALKQWRGVVMNYFDIHQALPNAASVGDEEPEAALVRLRAVRALREIQQHCRFLDERNSNTNNNADNNTDNDTTATDKTAVKKLRGILLEPIKRIAVYPQSAFGDKLAVQLTTSDLMQASYVTRALGDGYHNKKARHKAVIPAHIEYNTQLTAVDEALEQWKTNFAVDQPANAAQQMINLRKKLWEVVKRTGADDADVNNYLAQLYTKVVGGSSDGLERDQISTEIDKKGVKKPYWVLVRTSLLSLAPYRRLSRSPRDSLSLTT